MLRVNRRPAVLVNATVQQILTVSLLPSCCSVLLLFTDLLLNEDSSNISVTVLCCNLVPEGWVKNNWTSQHVCAQQLRKQTTNDQKWLQQISYYSTLVSCSPFMLGDRPIKYLDFHTQKNKVGAMKPVGLKSLVPSCLINSCKTKKQKFITQS